MSDTLPVVVSVTESTKGVFGAGSSAAIVDVPLDKLQANLAALVTKLETATAGLTSVARDLSLKEIEIGLEITAEGGVSLIGTAKAGATATVKLTFGRNQ